MEGLMQDYELSLQHILWRIERLHQKKEVVTKRDEGIHRTTYAAAHSRAKLGCLHEYSPLDLRSGDWLFNIALGGNSGLAGG